MLQVLAADRGSLSSGPDKPDSPSFTCHKYINACREVAHIDLFHISSGEEPDTPGIVNTAVCFLA